MKRTESAEASPELEIDPLYQRTRREAFLIFGLWGVALLWCVGFSYLYGYETHAPVGGSVGPAIAEIIGPLEDFNRDAGELTTVLGVPDWVMFGVLVPWLVFLLVTVLFLFFVYRDEDLEPPAGPSPEGADHEQ